MELQAARFEFESLKKSQRDLHVANSDKDPMVSNYHYENYKSLWHSTARCKMESYTSEDETIYPVHKSFHFLNYSYMRWQVPSVRVKKEFANDHQIAWCHNLAHNIILRATFNDDDSIYQNFDNHWLDMYSQFYQRTGSGKRKNYNIAVGNIPSLEEWNTKLPKYVTNIDHPWFYAFNLKNAFPIFLKNSLSKIEHRYKFRKSIFELLRVRRMENYEDHVKNGAQPIWISVNQKINQIVDVAGGRTDIKPELWGHYSYSTEKELEWFKCFPSRHFYIRNVETVDGVIDTTYSNKLENPLDSNDPCIALFWAAENKNASDNRNYSNYTTNSESVYQGWSPIKNVTVRYGTKIKFDAVPSDHFSISEPRHNFPSSPDNPGYCALSIAQNSSSIYSDIGLIYRGMQGFIQVILDDGDINVTHEQYDNNGNCFDEDYAEFDLNRTPTFILRCRFLTIHKLTIEQSTKGGEKIFIFKV